MQVWTTASLKRLRSIKQSYYRRAHAAIIAYDLTRKSTFKSVPHWIDHIKQHRTENLVIMLIGNKCDLSEKRHVLFEEACTLAENYGLLAVLETSAKESKNIDEVFERMARELIARNSLPLSEESAQNNLWQDQLCLKAPFEVARTMQFSNSARAADDNFDYSFKIIVLGDTNVGKTCVVQHFKSGVYTETQQITVQWDITTRPLEVDGKKVKMHVWDTAGLKRFRTITHRYYRSADGAIIAYDITRKCTFTSVPHWIDDIKQHGAENLVVTLIGNKCDLSEERHVLFEEACTLAEKYGLVAVLETSAKESRNIDEVFVLMARELITRKSLHLSEENAQNNLWLDELYWKAPLEVARAMQYSNSARAEDEKFDYLFNIILIGDSNVGKTCVAQHFISGSYTETQKNTTWVELIVRTLEIDGKKVKMQVCDTASQESFRARTKLYYHKAHAAIIAYDLTRKSTFDSVPSWIHEIEKYGPENLLVMLIAPTQESRSQSPQLTRPHLSVQHFVVAGKKAKR
ncbi:uncharacterized protein LOC109439797 isoform X2 [Rhinolophus sinicus]|uniref:uncharacterized protein LOC109439797 isoform X2 n=1 Tax=Rhinolophus sinicus TaxID=89399 RepID=UPI003D7AB814